jgi:hypothetical protein
MATPTFIFPNFPRIKQGSFFTKNDYNSPVPIEEKEEIKGKRKKFPKKNKIHKKQFGSIRLPKNTRGWKMSTNYDQLIERGDKMLFVKNGRYLAPSQENLKKWGLTTIRDDKFFIYTCKCRCKCEFIVQWVDDLDEYNLFMEKLNQLCTRK